MDASLGEDSNLKKYLFVPFDSNKLPQEDCAKLMSKHTDFRMHYKGLSLNETVSVDKKFTLNKEECKELGFNDESAPKTTSIRKIIQSWRANNGSALVWTIESATANRQVMIVSKTHLEIVCSETAHLFKLLHSRHDFRAIVGTDKAYVDGYERKSGNSGVYQDMLQSTVLQITEASDQFPSLPEVPKHNAKRQPPTLARAPNHKRLPNPYSKNNYMETTMQGQSVNNNPNKQAQHQTAPESNSTVIVNHSKESNTQLMSTKEMQLH